MNARKELKDLMAEYKEARTSGKLEQFDKKMDSVLSSKTGKDKEAFAEAFTEGAEETIQKAKNLMQEIDLKQKLEGIKEVISLSFISKKYFGKSRHWLYQRINGSTINGKPARFTEDELKRLSQALDEISCITKNVSRSIV